MIVMFFMRPNSIRILFAVFILQFSIFARGGQASQVRGIFIWEENKATSDNVTIRECKSGRIYRVRILASGRHFTVYKRMKQLTAKGHENIIAEFSGELELENNSSDSNFVLNGTLYVDHVISMENGNCE